MIVLTHLHSRVHVALPANNPEIIPANEREPSLQGTKIQPTPGQIGRGGTKPGESPAQPTTPDH
jgi:hypothetical protein